MASPRIEPGSGASEALILSIVLRSHKKKSATLILSPSELCSAGRALYYEAIKKISDSYTIPVRTVFSQAGIVLRSHKKISNSYAIPVRTLLSRAGIVLRSHIYFTNIKNLFSKIYNIGSKYFYCNCKQNNTKKFSYHQQTIWTQCTLYPF